MHRHSHRDGKMLIILRKGGPVQLRHTLHQFTYIGPLQPQSKRTSIRFGHIQRSRDHLRQPIQLLNGSRHQLRRMFAIVRGKRDLDAAAH